MMTRIVIELEALPDERNPEIAEMFDSIANGANVLLQENLSDTIKNFMIEYCGLKGKFVPRFSFETSSNKQGVMLALEYAVRYGGIDESHHRAWVIDQMVRALTNCPLRNETQGESEMYKKLVADACNGEDGPNTHDWDTGVAP